MAAISYVWGQKHWSVPYNVGRVLLYMAGAVVLWWGCEQLRVEGFSLYAIRFLVPACFIGVVWRNERRTSSPSHG